MHAASREAFFCLAVAVCLRGVARVLSAMPDLLSAYNPRNCHNVTERGEIVAAHHHVLLSGQCKLCLATGLCGAVIARFSGTRPVSSVSRVSVLIKAFSAVLDQHDQERAMSPRRRLGGGAGIAAPLPDGFTTARVALPACFHTRPLHRLPTLA